MRIAHSSLVRLALVLIAVFGFLAVSVPADAVATSATVVPSPNSSPTDDNELRSVSCVSMSWCLAVGTSYDGTANQALVERWDGTTWSILPSANSQLSGDTILNSVSCVSVSWCVAVGYVDDGTTTGPLMELWDGSSLSIQREGGVPPGGFEQLNSVSCASVSWCVAVGSFTYGFYYQDAVFNWDGTSWHVMMPPSTSPTNDDGLNSVSCVSASMCVAVGGYYDGSVNRTLLLGWDGITWSIVQSPNAGSSRDRLTGVSCVSVTFCLAVGTYIDSDWRTLAEVWNGATWSVLPSANAAEVDGIVPADGLKSVSCVTASSCVAVGDYSAGVASQNFVATWDGSAWTIVPSENAGTDSNYLESVSCAADSSCVAVGRYKADGYQTLVVSMIESEPPTSSTTVPPTTATDGDPVLPAFTG